MILHVDMDAFYASIEERERPELAGRPLIVGGTPQGRGVVAAANYAVRQYGVHSAMPTRRALELCPHATILPVRMDLYSTVARQIREIYHRYTPLVEPLALDEAFLDVTGSQSLFGDAAKVGRRIKEEVLDELGLVASVGVAPNKFLAKIASDLDKPDGFVIVPPEGVQQFLDPLPISRLWGVGRVTEQQFLQRGIRTIGQLRQQTVEMLTSRFGTQGTHLWQLSQGIDDRRVVPDRIAKSISHETTFDTDIEELEMLRAWALDLADQVARRLRRLKKRCRTVHLKVRYADFHTVTRSLTLESPSNVTATLCKATVEMLDRRLPEDRRLSVRLLGVGVSGLQSAETQQRTLFDDEATPQDDELDQASDEIRDRFGIESLSRASSLLRKRRDEPSR